MDHCEVPRWMLLKSQISNLTYSSFFEQYKSDKKAMLLDVRTKEEFDAESVEGAYNLDYLSHQLADDLEQLDPSKKYYIFCKTGRRSLRVCVLLKNMGYEAINLEGGLISGYPS